MNDPKVWPPGTESWRDVAAERGWDAVDAEADVALWCDVATLMGVLCLAGCGLAVLLLVW